MKRSTNPTYALDHIEWDRKVNPSGEDGDNPPENDIDAEAPEPEETFTHADVPEAADWLAGLLRKRGVEADFSPDSLIALDRFISDSVSAQLPGNRDFFSEDISYRAFSVGAYVGEVIRRAVGGEWQSDDHDPLIEINIALRLPDDRECFPMKRVFERMNLGSGASFTRFAVDNGVGIMDAPALEPDPEPASAGDFNVRGFVMLWYTPATTPGAIEYHFAADTTACVNLLGYFSFLESRTIPSLKSIKALTEDDGVVLPESHLDGETRGQMGVFYDPDQDSDYWRLVDDSGQLYIEMGHDRLIEFKNAVTTIFLGHDMPVIGSPGQLLQLWPKADIESPEEPEIAVEADDS